ncbi:MAG: hypothetical protein HWE25_11880 [Alphaproteobacteria bacterium]|nr:hypothetical protein [Alphaproteobacteria bacterium]
MPLSMAWADLKGDEKAISLAHEMLDAMGGRDVWSNAVWMHVVERSYSPSQKKALRHEAWRGLQVEKARYTTANEDIAYEQAWDADAGWRIRNGEYQQFDEERHRLETDFWYREIYTMYHRLAAGDPALTLTLNGDRGFRVADVNSGAPLGSFTISAEGGVLVWSSGDSEFDVTYVYGPLRSFGQIRLPEWGAQTNGGWRFNYVEATLHSTPMEDDMRPPMR